MCRVSDIGLTSAQPGWTKGELAESLVQLDLPHLVKSIGKLREQVSCDLERGLQFLFVASEAQQPPNTRVTRTLNPGPRDLETNKP